MSSVNNEKLIRCSHFFLQYAFNTITIQGLLMQKSFCCEKQFYSSFIVKNLIQKINGAHKTAPKTNAIFNTNGATGDVKVSLFNYRNQRNVFAYSTPASPAVF